MSVKYTFKEFDTETFDSSKLHWLDSLDNLGIPQTEYNQTIEYTEKRINYTENTTDSFIYGVFEKDSKSAAAFVEVVFNPVKSSGRIKLLKVTFSPNYLDEDLKLKAALLNDIIHIYSASIAGTIGLNNKSSGIIKIFSRTNLMMMIFVSLVNEFNSHSELSSQYLARIEGRWLVIEEK
jgi:hypothetical protein